MKKNNVDLVTKVLLIIGGLNLGLIGIAGLDLIAKLGVSGVKIANILIGLSAVYIAYKEYAK